MCSREGAKAQRCRSRPVVVVSAPAAALTNGVRERSTTPHAHHLGAFAPSREHIDGSPDTTVAKGPGVDFVRAEARRRGGAEARRRGGAEARRRGGAEARRIRSRFGQRFVSSPHLGEADHRKPHSRKTLAPERPISALTLRVSASPREPNQLQPKPPPWRPATPAQSTKEKGGRLTPTSPNFIP